MGIETVGRALPAERMANDQKLRANSFLGEAAGRAGFVRQSRRTTGTCAATIAVLRLDGRNVQKVDDHPIPSNGVGRTGGGHRLRGLDSGQADEKMPLGDNDLVWMAHEDAASI